jgi:CRISPR/Cas system-associated exonuclease Cas4 (RecB family)
MKDGITFQIKDEDIAVLEESAANERMHNSHRVKLDISAYKRMMEQALREQAEFLVEQENYNDKIKASMERLVEIAVKSIQGRIDRLVADEVERLVRERVLALVQGLPIAVEVSVGGKP